MLFDFFNFHLSLLHHCHLIAARGQGILRTLWIRHGMTVVELAYEFGINKRDMDRDLTALQNLGYPLFFEVIEG